VGLREWFVGREVAANRRDAEMGKLGPALKAIWNALDGWKTWIIAVAMALHQVFPGWAAWGYFDAVANAIGWSSVAPAVDPGQLAAAALFLVATGHRLWKAVRAYRAGVPLADIHSEDPAVAAALERAA